MLATVRILSGTDFSLPDTKRPAVPPMALVLAGPKELRMSAKEAISD